MSEGAKELVYRHALGLAEGMTKATTAINELLMIADRERVVLEGALERARREAGVETANVEGPGAQAPALLAIHLLERALEEVTP